MKKAKRDAIIKILIFLACLAGLICMAVYGVGKEETGKAANIPLGLDLQGGLSVTYDIVDENPSDDEIDATIDKLQRRVDEYSSEGEVYKEGNDRITVEIPVDTSKYDAHEILDDLGQPGQLLFLDETNYSLWASGAEYEAALTGADIKNAEPATDTDDVTGTREYVVSLQFTDEGTQKFADITSANIGNIIYIIYDGAVASAPRVKTAITGGNAVINGMADYDEASQLAATIKIGALPLELSQLQYNIVGAKLGREAISTSLVAGAIGFGLVCLLMIVIYLVPGLVAAVALVAYVVLMLLILSIRTVTLTLPGIAGIILSIGMAVDANVIIFTRIKEEIAADKNIRNAVEAGFSKALSAILDGNITTLIASFVLMLLGTGSIKGFATTLMIGIILSMFTALVITKFLLKSVVDIGITNKKFYGSAKPIKKVNYIKVSRVCVVISILAIILGLVFMPINKSRLGSSLNYALEFTGGTSTTVTFEGDVIYDLEKAEAEVVPVITEATGISAGVIQIQTVEDSNQVIFKTPELSEQDSAKLENAIKDNFEVSEINEQSISSTISGEMKKDAVIAIIIASILMLIYIAIRFSDVRFGASAVLALLHDVFVVFAIYSIARLSVGNTFIACMLTIVGYSINATIIIFDRIRENLKIMDRNVGLDEVVNTSIAQTFTRSIYTSLTTFIMVLVLFIMGVASLKEFTFTLMAGIVIGAYSSICITGPMWYFFKKHIGKKQVEEAK
ncbi:MAG: protein translocase subunit SecD [Lachnospiraceae bacterium]|nr:protein translocase subunit SecD [Lachnospiraceae bacterium]